MNVITLDGNVVDPGTLKELAESQRVRVIRIAHNRGKDKPALFLDCEVWNGWAENFRGEKGDPVVVSGELRQDSWEDKDGKSQQKTYVRAREVKLLARKPAEAEPAAQ